MMAEVDEGEDIMVNTPYDVFILPLQPSGLSSGPRFVVHVPGPEQPAAVDDMVVVERIAALLHEEASGEPWTVAGVEHPGTDRDYYRRLASKVAHLIAAQSAEIEALRAERDALKAENARLREALDELLEALQAIVDEVSDGLIPYSSDSYLPAHLVEQARAALAQEARRG
jgi:hypothetical protein